MTWMEAGTLASSVLLSNVQWAAVRTWRLVIREPPHQGTFSPGDTRPTCIAKYETAAQSSSFLNVSVNTCQGYSFTSVSTPPTILVLLLTRPQLQVPVGPEELGVVVIPDPSVVVVSDSSVVVAAVVVVVTTK